jgi:molecular chaperone GrpE
MNEQEMTQQEPEVVETPAEEAAQEAEVIDVAALTAAAAKAEEYLALAQRTQADFDNFRRRNASVRSESLEEGKRNCIKELLPVLDNFDRAMENDGAAEEAWHEGVRLVHRQLLDTLQKLGMSEVETDGKFDPNLHNAVMQEKVEGKESGDILAVFQKGYRVGDRIIRYSMVKVAE